MSILGSHLLNLKNYSPQQIEQFFNFVDSLNPQKNQRRNSLQDELFKMPTLAMMFFEPSTRTRLSFEMACHRAHCRSFFFDGGESTSLEKGETIEDSIYNVLAMQPEGLLVRCSDKINISEIIEKKIPELSPQTSFISAGWGTQAHPTQALLDAYTLYVKFKKLKGLKLALVGDIKHSRVASSHFELLQVLGVEVVQCGPESFLRQGSSVRKMDSVDAALDWADAVMALRVQLERHTNTISLSNAPTGEIDQETYRKNFGLTKDRLKKMRKDQFILHPGPVNHGVELDSAVFDDPRSLIFSQVKNGVYVREALLRMFLKKEI